MTYIHIRRGWGAFVRCKSEFHARRRAKHWHETGKGGDPHAKDGKVIGLFIGESKYPSENTRTQLYP